MRLFGHARSMPSPPWDTLASIEATCAANHAPGSPYSEPSRPQDRPMRPGGRHAASSF
jgi:hypothetical protein